MDNIKLGRQGEQAAAEYLYEHGYDVLERNYRCPVGELDIVARRENVLVFVEVKTRRSLRYGRPCEAVSYYKKQHIIKTAKWYLVNRNITGLSYRFDIIEILIMPGSGMSLNHIEGAFEVN